MERWADLLSAVQLMRSASVKYVGLSFLLFLYHLPLNGLFLYLFTLIGREISVPKGTVVDCRKVVDSLLLQLCFD